MKQKIQANTTNSVIPFKPNITTKSLNVNKGHIKTFTDNNQYNLKESICNHLLYYTINHKDQFSLQNILLYFKEHLHKIINNKSEILKFLTAPNGLAYSTIFNLFNNSKYTKAQIIGFYILYIYLYNNFPKDEKQLARSLNRFFNNHDICFMNIDPKHLQEIHKHGQQTIILHSNFCFKQCYDSKVLSFNTLTSNSYKKYNPFIDTKRAIIQDHTTKETNVYNEYTLKINNINDHYQKYKENIDKVIKVLQYPFFKTESEIIMLIGTKVKPLNSQASYTMLIDNGSYATVFLYINSQTVKKEIYHPELWDTLTQNDIKNLTTIQLIFWQNYIKLYNTECSINFIYKKQGQEYKLLSKFVSAYTSNQLINMNPNTIIQKEDIMIAMIIATMKIHKAGGLCIDNKLDNYKYSLDNNKIQAIRLDLDLDWLILCRLLNKEEHIALGNKLECGIRASLMSPMKNYFNHNEQKLMYILQSITGIFLSHLDKNIQANILQYYEELTALNNEIKYHEYIAHQFNVKYKEAYKFLENALMNLLNNSTITKFLDDNFSIFQDKKVTVLMMTELLISNSMDALRACCEWTTEYLSQIYIN